MSLNVIKSRNCNTYTNVLQTSLNQLFYRLSINTLKVFDVTICERIHSLHEEVPCAYMCGNSVVGGKEGYSTMSRCTKIPNVGVLG